MTELDDATINELVATRIMGWHKERCLSAQPRWVDAAGQTVMPVAEWHPVQDIAQAWMVAERMRALGYGVEIGSTTRTPDFWYAIFDKGDDMESEWDAPIGCVVCLAALRAVGAID